MCHILCLGPNTSNYRPISILSLFSKIQEKLYDKRIFAFIKAINILNNNQFGFRPNTSTSHAIGHVITNLLEGQYC